MSPGWIEPWIPFETTDHECPCVDCVARVYDLHTFFQYDFEPEVYDLSAT